MSESREVIDEITNALKAEMLECEAMIPITIGAAIEAGIQLRGAESIYTYFADITDDLALKAAEERNKRTDSIMKTFVPRG